jgi:hypothetical protein
MLILELRSFLSCKSIQLVKKQFLGLLHEGYNTPSSSVRSWAIMLHHTESLLDTRRECKIEGINTERLKKREKKKERGEKARSALIKLREQ